ncbi:MAG: O-antigen ligase family protein [Bacteroidota bacterium]
MLSYRVEIESEFSAEGGNLLNPIIISFFGASLSILSINLFLFFKNYNKFLLAFCVVLGIANLAFGASRGPFYSFFVLILATFAYKNFQTKFQISRLLKSISIFFLVSIVIYISLSLLIEIDELTIVKRITIGQELQEFGQEEYRNFAYQYAFQDFLEHPLLGNHFVGSYDQTYPHNVMIEVLMATGIVGGIFYFTAFLSFMVRFFYVFKSDNRELFIIFLICILTISLSLTSGSIFVNPESWILFSLALTIKIDKKA